MDETTLVIALIVTATLLFYGQFLVAIYYPLFKGKGVRGRWIFVLAAPLLTGSVVFFSLLFFALPIGLVSIYIAPVLKQAFEYTPFWIVLPNQMGKYLYFAIPLIWGTLGFILTRLLWPRWPALLSALLGEPIKLAAEHPNI